MSPATATKAPSAAANLIIEKLRNMTEADNLLVEGGVPDPEFGYLIPASVKVIHAIADYFELANAHGDVDEASGMLAGIDAAVRQSLQEEALFDTFTDFGIGGF